MLTDCSVVCSSVPCPPSYGSNWTVAKPIQTSRPRISPAIPSQRLPKDGLPDSHRCLSSRRQGTGSWGAKLRKFRWRCWAWKRRRRRLGPWYRAGLSGGVGHLPSLRQEKDYLVRRGQDVWWVGVSVSWVLYIAFHSAVHVCAKLCLNLIVNK